MIVFAEKAHKSKSFYFLIIDGKRYDIKERAAYYELVGIIKKNLK